MDTHDFLADPRAISLQDRRAHAARMQREQNHWLGRLTKLTEPPALERDFPAYLLATPHFRDLARRIGDTTRSQMPTAVVDELDWFVDAFRDYLRTADGEDSFTVERRLRA